MNDSERRILGILVEKSQIRRTYESLLGLMDTETRSMRAGGAKIRDLCGVTQQTAKKHISLLEMCGVVIVRQYDNGEPNEYLFPRLTDRFLEKALRYKLETIRPWREIVGMDENTTYWEDDKPIDRSIIEAKWEEARVRQRDLMDTE